MNPGKQDLIFLAKQPLQLCSIIALFIGVFIEAEPKFGPWMDIVTIYIVPFGAVLGAFSIYYILGYKEIRQELELARKPLGAYFGITAKYIYVPLTIIIFCSRNYLRWYLKIKESISKKTY